MIYRLPGSRKHKKLEYLKLLVEKFTLENMKHFLLVFVDRRVNKVYEYDNVNNQESKILVRDWVSSRFANDPEEILNELEHKPGYWSELFYINKIPEV